MHARLLPLAAMITALATLGACGDPTAPAAPRVALFQAVDAAPVDAAPQHSVVILASQHHAPPPPRHR